jgi:hypothetical protein
MSSRRRKKQKLTKEEKKSRYEKCIQSVQHLAKPKGNEPKDKVPVQKCVICVEDIIPENLVILDECSHPYCFTCITEWSKVTNTCPQCNVVFTGIKLIGDVNKRKPGQAPIVVPVKNNDKRRSFHSDEFYDDFTYDSYSSSDGDVNYIEFNGEADEDSLYCNDLLYEEEEEEEDLEFSSDDDKCKREPKRQTIEIDSDLEIVKEVIPLDSSSEEELNIEISKDFISSIKRKRMIKK